LNKTALLLTATMAALVSGADGGPLFSLDPRLNKPVIRSLSNFSDAAGHKVQVSKDFLAKPHLFYFAVTATSEASIDMGIISEVTLVRQVQEGDEVKLIRAKTSPGGQEGEMIASFKTKPVGDKIELDLTTDFAMRLEGGVYKAEAPTKTQDVELKGDRLAYTQLFELKNPEAQGEAPKQVTLGLRFWCIERDNPGYQPKEYPDANRKKHGYFTLNLFSGGEVGAPATPGDYLLRRDIRKPMVYTLHPNVPERFRERVKKGILSWNQVFKRTHGVEPIQVVQGTNPNVVPGDPDTNIVWWFPSDVPKMYLGQAHPIGDPRTGEIFSSYTMFSQSEFEGAVMTTAVGMQVEGPDALPPAPTTMRIGKGASITLVSKRENLAENIPAAVFAEGTPAGTLLEKIVDWTVPHEAGHSLGLRHNFKSTTDLKNLEQGHYCATVMEYLPPMQAPMSPKGYDYATIAYGYEGQVPAEYNKPYAYATDEDQRTDPDCNTYDLGEPLAYLTKHFKHIRRARPTLTQDGDPGIYLSLLVSAVSPLPKFLGVPQDPRHPLAVDFLVNTIKDQGTIAAPAGGNGGEPNPQPSADFVYTKNLMERVAIIRALGRMDRRVQVAPEAAKKMIAALEATVTDAPKTDVFTARVVAIPGLLAFGMPGAEALVRSAKSIIEFAKANPQAPTIKQEAALLSIIKKALTPPEQPQPQPKADGPRAAAPIDPAARPGVSIR
jgi:hypothetical protein